MRCVYERHAPRARYSKQLTMVMSINGTSHTWLSLTVDVPSNMNITVSVMLLNILRKYLIVVCDFSDMLKMTYCFITIPQNVSLKQC